MKNKMFFGVILMTAIFFSSCQKDVTTNSPHKLTLYGMNLTLNSGVIWQSNKNVVAITKEYIWQDVYTDEEGTDMTEDVVGITTTGNFIESGNFILSLYGEGLVYSPSIGVTKGSGAVVSLHLASKDLDKLTLGKYKFEKSKAAGTFVGFVSTQYNLTTGDASAASIAEGEVNITQSGSEYTVTATGKLASGLPFNCSYTGALAQRLVKQEKIVSIKGINISGLKDETTTGTWLNPDELWGDGEIQWETGFDYIDNALLPISVGVAQNADYYGDKSSIEIAVINDSINNKLIFTSPIKVRAKLGHDNTYNFPCHTIYMKAPATFTESDFNKLEETIVNIKDVTDETVEFDLTTATYPQYVFFSAGNGTKGVIKVKGFNPVRMGSFDPFGSGGLLAMQYDYYSPQLICDIKATSNFRNPKIR